MAAGFSESSVCPEKRAALVYCDRMTADFNVGIVAGERQLQRIFVPADRAGDGYASVIERSKQQKRQTAGFARPFMSCRMPHAELPTRE
jgi:hypothetical protein